MHSKGRTQLTIVWDVSHFGLLLCLPVKKPAPWTTGLSSLQAHSLLELMRRKGENGVRVDLGDGGGVRRGKSVFGMLCMREESISNKQIRRKSGAL